MGKSSSGGFSTLGSDRVKLDAAIKSGEFRLLNRDEIEVVQNGTIKVNLKTREYPDFTEVVNAGAQLLDEVDPGWYMAIDTSALDLDDKNMCVLGQSWNHYKTVESAVAQRVEHGNGYLYDNFSRFLSALKSKGKDMASEGAKYGFSFSSPVYAWSHLEAARRVESGEEKSLTWYYIGDTRVNKHLAWKIDAELWELLTKTWLVMIEARQKVHAKAEQEQADKEKAAVNGLTDKFVDTGMYHAEARKLAERLTKQGITVETLGDSF